MRFRLDVEHPIRVDSRVVGVSRYVFWTIGSKARSWWNSDDDVEDYESIAAAETALAGVTYRASVLLPSLLVPALSSDSRFPFDPTSALAGEETIGSSRCYRLVSGDGETDIFVDRDDLLLRKVIWRAWINPDEPTRVSRVLPTQSGYVPPQRGLRFEQTTEFEAVLDEEIDPARLVFTPPRPVPHT